MHRQSVQVALPKYEILKELGRGKFGIVYMGRRVKDAEPVAIKVETHPHVDTIKILKHETTMLNYLHNHKCTKIPSVYWYGISEKMPVLVMTYYEMSLEEYLETDQTFTPQDGYRIAAVLISILDAIHRHHVIHRDIKPANFMMRGGDIFLIDFGLATFYVDTDVRHIEYKEGKDIIGTPKYISPNIHRGVEAARRDDLISLGYIYMIMLYGSLPWEGQSLETAHLAKSWENVGPMLHPPVRDYIKKCYELDYKETLDYSDWISTFLGMNCET